MVSAECLNVFIQISFVFCGISYKNNIAHLGCFSRCGGVQDHGARINGRLGQGVQGITKRVGAHNAQVEQAAALQVGEGR